jgi:ABC-type iron transport system FetAB ATPase subunit
VISLGSQIQQGDIQFRDKQGDLMFRNTKLLYGKVEKYRKVITYGSEVQLGNIINDLLLFPSRAIRLEINA